MPEFDASRKFPINAFTPLSPESTPTYADIRQLQDEMNSCTQAIKNSACLHGYSYLSHTDAFLILAPGEPYFHPVHPGPTAPDTHGMTGAVVTKTIRAYTALVSTYKKHQDVEDCLKKLVVTAVPPIYLKPLRKRHTGLLLVSCKAIITHLWLTFGKVTRKEINENLKKCEAPWCRIRQKVESEND
jgi:hypothetical protein